MTAPTGTDTTRGADGVPVCTLKVVQDDPWLEPYGAFLDARMAAFCDKQREIEAVHGSVRGMAEGYRYFGLNRLCVGDADGVGADPWLDELSGVGSCCRSTIAGDGTCDCWLYREWAPGATALSLVGDFNGWDGTANVCERNEFGVWTALLHAGDARPEHGSRIKARLTLADGSTVDRVPAWVHRAEATDEVAYHGIAWDVDGEDAYVWQHDEARAEILADSSGLRIYEAHVGIASAEEHVSSYTHFTEHVLPHIAEMGYNTIQLMAVMEHPYYACFGYQVTSFFAASSRYGAASALKALIDTAHSLGLRVLLDVVHSHAAKNVLDGINRFDGTDAMYFHGGPRGDHPLWDSRVFNYGHWEVLRFLLSNLCWWVDTFHFDGFRFDGVTSMMYLHHGAGFAFSGDYGEYFGEAIDTDAMVYLMLANAMLHAEYPGIITIAEDVSGMPTLCRPTCEGGVGFDYRLAMSIPDMWIKLLKEVRDEDWDMGHIVHTLSNRRYREATVAYAESHDQALVGDKAIFHHLLDAGVYTDMSVFNPRTAACERAMALHMMIRAITLVLGGEAWLGFIGNEFGHPEWLDFPREGNHNSFLHARRQWPLLHNPDLRYRYLAAFERDLHAIQVAHPWLGTGATSMYVSRKHEGDKVIAVDHPEEALVFVFNFHPSKSFSDYRIGVPRPGKYTLLLTTETYDGLDRCDPSVPCFSQPEPWDGRDQFIYVYSPSRSLCVFLRDPSS